MLLREVVDSTPLRPLERGLYDALLVELAMVAGPATVAHVSRCGPAAAPVIAGALGRRLDAAVHVEAAGGGAGIGIAHLDGNLLVAFLFGSKVDGTPVADPPGLRLAVTVIMPAAWAVLSAAFAEACAQSKILHTLGADAALLDVEVGHLKGWPDDFDMADGHLRVQSVERTVSISQCGDASGPGSLIKIVRRVDGSLWARSFHAPRLDLPSLPPQERLDAAMAAVDAMLAQPRLLATLHEHGKPALEMSRTAPVLLREMRRGGEVVVGHGQEVEVLFRQRCVQVLSSLLS